MCYCYSLNLLQGDTKKQEINHYESKTSPDVDQFWKIISPLDLAVNFVIKTSLKTPPPS